MLSGRLGKEMLLLGALFWAVGGCTIDGVWGPRVKFERTVELQQAMPPGAMLAVATASGSIDAAGRETNQAHVVATIQARAGSEDEARELAEQVNVHFEQAGTRFTLKADHPPLPPTKSVSVSYKLDLPRQTGVDADSASGSVRVRDLTGNVKAHTASGSLEAARVQGTVRLHTASGSVEAEEVGNGDVDLESASGSVRLSQAANVGTCELNSASGSAVASNVTANSIRMSSASGHVALTEAQAKEIRVHSSSGGVKAESISCSRLNAESTSGSVTIGFVREALAEVVADVTAGSGNIHVTAPYGFSGHVDLSTISGSIDTDLPVTVTGKLGKHHISGFVGKGSGSLTLRATSGSIRVR